MPAEFTDHYDVLGVSPAATREEIERAHREQVRRWHPDVNPDPQATSRTQQINVARDVLLDPQRRAVLDRELSRRNGHAARAAAGSRRTAEGQRAYAAEQAERRRQQAEEHARRQAAERQRRERAEQEARELRERLRREAEERARRDAERVDLAWDDQAFVPGHWYANRSGPFEVLTADSNTVRVRYRNGLEHTLPVGTLWLGWQEEARRRADREGRPFVFQHYRPAAGPSELEIASALNRMHTPAEVFRYLEGCGWGRMTDQRKDGGALRFTPERPWLTRFSRVIAELSAHRSGFDVKFDTSRPPGALPSWIAT